MFSTAVTDAPAHRGPENATCARPMLAGDGGPARAARRLARSLFLLIPVLAAAGAGLAIAQADDPQLAQCLSAMATPDLKIASCSAVIAARTQPPGDLSMAFFMRALVFMQKGSGDRAIQDASEAIRVAPSFAPAYNLRGLVYRQQGQQRRAIQDFGEAIRANPTFVPAYNNRGITYAQIGEYDHAIADFDSALRLKPNLEIALANRGNAYLSKGQLDRAIADLDEALRLDPHDADAMRARQTAAARKSQTASVAPAKPRPGPAPAGPAERQASAEPRKDTRAPASKTAPAAVPGSPAGAPESKSPAPLVPQQGPQMQQGATPPVAALTLAPGTASLQSQGSLQGAASVPTNAPAAPLAEIMGPPMPPPSPAVEPAGPEAEAPSACADAGEEDRGGTFWPGSSDRTPCSPPAEAEAAERQPPPESKAAAPEAGPTDARQAEAAQAGATRTEDASDDGLVSLVGRIADLFGGSSDNSPPSLSPSSSPSPSSEPQAPAAAEPQIAMAGPPPPGPLAAARPRVAVPEVVPEVEHEACPNSALSYISVGPATGKRDIGENGYAIENHCAAYEISVEYQVTSDEDCDTTRSHDVAIPASRWVGDYSLCDKQPEILRARFKR